MSRQRYIANRILTMDEASPYAQEMVVESGRILAVGEASKQIPCDEVFELREGVVLPGFIDAHTHFLQMGIQRMQVDLRGTASIEEALARLEQHAREMEPGKWIVGNRWDESQWCEGRYITRRDLDRVSPDHPIIARRMCEHLWVANTCALQSVDIPPQHRKGLSPETGLLRWEAKNYFWHHMQPAREELPYALQLASELALEKGVTSVHEWHSDFRTLWEADRTQLGVKVIGGPPSDLLESLKRFQLPVGFGSAYVRLGAVKFFADGSLGARTAALHEPYTDAPSQQGDLVWDAEALAERLTIAHQAGLQIAIHAIGDRGIDVALKALREAIESDPDRPQRHRIEHCEMPNRWALDAIQELGIIVSAQPNFTGEWGRKEGMYEQRLGAERFRFLNPLGTFQRLGIPMAFGSDGMPLDPLYGLWSATQHPVADERLHPERSIHYYTLGSAYAGFEEHDKGKLAPGMAADFVLLSADPTHVPVHELLDIEVLMTVVDGEHAYVR